MTIVTKPIQDPQSAITEPSMDQSSVLKGDRRKELQAALTGHFFKTIDSARNAPETISKAWRSGQIASVLRDWTNAEAGRLALFVPVFLAAGIGLYFASPSEPGWYVLGIAIPIIGLLTVLHAHLGARTILLSLLIVIAGFGLAKGRTALVSAPVLTSDLNFVDLQGTVLSVEARNTGYRIILKPHRIEGVTPREMPAKIRLTWRGKTFTPRPGDAIAVPASLSPPPETIMPGGYDFARQLYFQRIGGVGFLVGTPTILAQGELGEGLGATSASIQKAIRLQIERLRSALFLRIRRAAPSDGGAIVAAIVTGKREAITPEAQNALRDSGLAHLLAISGLHMGLATGLIFFTVRFLLSRNTGLALSRPIKKWSALAALASGFLYLIISGSGWSARRAFIMSSIVFIAILVDRRALSLRSVAIAALIILILTPEALLHPGFQMSFAAVTALIAAYEWHSHRQRTKSAPRLGRQGVMSRLKIYLIGIAATDTIAAGATAPFALYHFNRVALYSLPANLAAMPVMGLWVMPVIILALMTMPIGIDGFFWRLAADGMAFIVGVGSTVSARPGAVSVIASLPLSWLIVLVLGAVTVCLLRAPWRLAGLAALPITMAIAMVHQSPDIVIEPGGQNVGVVVTHEGQRDLAVYDSRRSRFAARVWRENLGINDAREDAGNRQKESRKPSPLRMNDVGLCDVGGCVLMVRGQKVSISERAETLDQDCQNADLVIALYPINRRIIGACESAVLDRRGAWERGARALWIENSGDIRMRSVHGVVDRPWRRTKNP